MKPVNESGGYCPFQSKAVKRVCHTCELWRPLEVTRQGTTREEWACSFNWTMTNSVLAKRRMDAIAVTNEQSRNATVELKATMLRLIATIVAAMRKQPIPLTEIEDGQKE